MGVKCMALENMPDDEPFKIFMIGTSNNGKNYRIYREQSELICLEYVLDGYGTVTEDGKTFIAGKGDTYMLHLDSEQDYYTSSEKPWRKIWMNFSGELAVNMIKAYGLEKVAYFPDFNALPYLEEIHETLSSGIERTEAVDKCARIFLKLLQKMHAEVYHKAPKRLSRAEEIKDYIDNYADSVVSLDDLSKRMYCSKTYIIRCFKDKYKMTPYTYIQLKKIERAKIMLEQTELSVSEISSNLGFCDSHYFSRFFKQNVKVSPRTYRKNMIKDKNRIK